MTRARRWVVGAASVTAVAAIACVGGEVVALRHSAAVVELAVRTTSVVPTATPSASHTAASPASPSGAPTTRARTSTLPFASTSTDAYAPAQRTLAGKPTSEPTSEPTSDSASTPTAKATTSAARTGTTSKAPAGKPTKSAPAAYLPSDTVETSAQLSKAVAYPKYHGGYRVGLAVFDTRTGEPTVPASTASNSPPSPSSRRSSPLACWSPTK